MATQAGLDILRAGGNAVDAAVATALAIGVAEPFMSGLGGDGFYHVFRASDGLDEVFNGSGPAPRSATPESFTASGMPTSGPLSASVPGALGAIGAMHAAHGSKPWVDLCAPAIALARDGVPVTRTYRRFAERLATSAFRNGQAGALFLSGGQVPPLGALIIQTNLSDTLEEVAQSGADSFYRGRLARAIVAAAQAEGMPFSLEDFESCHPLQQKPIAITYRGFEVRQTPPNSTGFALLQQLKIVERLDLKSLAPGSADLVHLLVEAKKRAFVDRETAGTDPLRAWDGSLVSDERAARLAATIDINKAADLPLRSEAASGDTTYFCVVDCDGNAVSGIQSLNGVFGSKIVAGRTGVVLNNRMACWHLDPSHPNLLAPGKRVRHTMNAPILLRDGALWVVLGTPSADDQVQINLQVIVSLVDHGLDPQEAVEAPRWSSDQAGQSSMWPHGGDNALVLEQGFPDETIRSLRERGHRVKTIDYLDGSGSVGCIRVLPNGVRMAASDPRRDGWAGAF